MLTKALHITPLIFGKKRIKSKPTLLERMKKTGEIREHGARWKYQHFDHDKVTLSSRTNFITFIFLTFSLYKKCSIASVPTVFINVKIFKEIKIILNDYKSFSENRNDLEYLTRTGSSIDSFFLE
jgi:hypothetical protein